MKNKGLVFVLGAVAMGFGTMTYSVPQSIEFAPAKVTKPTSKQGLRLPDRTPKGGPGPMCWSPMC
jgi:hypothetical protein